MHEQEISQSSDLPARLPQTTALLRRAQGILEVLRDVVQESSAEYWFEEGVKHKQNKNYEAAISCFNRYNNLAQTSLIVGLLQSICCAQLENRNACVDCLYQSQLCERDSLYEENIYNVSENEWYLLAHITSFRIPDRILDPVASMNYHHDYGASIIAYIRELSIGERNEFLKSFTVCTSAWFYQFISTHWFDSDTQSFYYKYGQRAPESELFYKFDLLVEAAEQIKGVEVSKSFWPRKEGVIWSIYERKGFRCDHLFSADTLKTFFGFIIKIMQELKISPKVVSVYEELFDEQTDVLTLLR